MKRLPMSDPDDVPAQTVLGWPLEGAAAEMSAEGGDAPGAPPTRARCQSCGTPVALGLHQQRILAACPGSRLLCVDCYLRRISDPSPRS